MSRSHLLLFALLSAACDGAPALGADTGVEPRDAGSARDAFSMPDAHVVSGPLAPMPRITDGVPSFASSGANPAAAHDGNPMSNWYTDGPLPAWLAYDVSALPIDQRQRVLVSFNNHGLPSYYNDPPVDGTLLEYTLESNPGAGGSEPPESGWRTLASVSGNGHVMREHLVDLAGDNWFRIRVTAVQGGGFALDMDLYDASAGFIDGWLILGDSISYMSFSRWTSDMSRRLIDNGVTEYTPFFDCAALGGTQAGNGLQMLDEALPEYLGHFVTLNFGTNDNEPDLFEENMTMLVERVLEAGKVPVIPTVPWPNDNDGHREMARMLTERIERVLAAHPDAIRGPDLYAYFEAHPEFTSVGDIHPDTAEVRRAWADWMASAIYRD
jgi:lysophospholipase L1-like esterase